MPLKKWRFFVGRSPQAVADYNNDQLRSDESMQLDANSLAGDQNPHLPVDTAGCTGFQDLPDELLEQIFLKLVGTSRRNYFSVCGVSKSWRKLGHRMFFASPWDTPHLICHPNQIFCLSPRSPTGSRSGLLKCFVRRETGPIPGNPSISGLRILFHLGRDPNNAQRARFLLCAVQKHRHQTLIYLNGKCEGPPCARLTSNFLCTSYTLTLNDGMSFLLDADLAPIENSIGPGSKQSSICAAMPQLMMSLRYRARIKGLMQPRRMDVALPNPSFMNCSRALPKVQTAGHQYGSSTSLASASVRRRPSFSNISSVAALEKPALPLQGGSLSSTPRPSAITVAPAPCSPGPSTSSASTSLAPSPLNPAALNEQEGEEIQSGEIAPPPPPIPTEQEEEDDDDDDDEGEVSFWRRAFSLGSSSRSSATFNRRFGGTSTSGSNSSSLLRPNRSSTVDESALPVCLRNKAPHWNEALRCWCLNFRGRVKLASVKNFQLVKDGDQDAKVMMQFGKVEKDTFILDFNPMTLSAIQAFAIALTTFDSKMAL